MKKYSACEDIYPAVECRDDSENRADIFNILSIDGDVELYLASEADEELCKTNHALWMTRAFRAKATASYWRYVAADNIEVTPIFKRYNLLYEKWKWAERKCLQKAKEYE